MYPLVPLVHVSISATWFSGDQVFQRVTTLREEIPPYLSAYSESVPPISGNPSNGHFPYHHPSCKSPSAQMFQMDRHSSL